MTKVILHGGNLRFDNKLNRKFAQELANGLDNNFKMLICLFAAEEKEWKKIFKGLRDIFNNYIPDEKIKFSLANKVDFISQIKENDVIYLHGGNTEWLLKDLTKKQNQKKEGRLH